MKHIDIIDIMKDASFVGKTVTVCGWVRTSRDSKNMAFVELNDGTTLKHLQLHLWQPMQLVSADALMLVHVQTYVQGLHHVKEQ